MLSLTDTSAEQGGFHCVPGVHRRLDEFFVNQPKLTDPALTSSANSLRDIDEEALAEIGLRVQRVPLRQGDCVIWHHLTLRECSNGRLRLTSHLI